MDQSTSSSSTSRLGDDVIGCVIDQYDDDSSLRRLVGVSKWVREQVLKAPGWRDSAHRFMDRYQEKIYLTEDAQKFPARDTHWSMFCNNWKRAIAVWRSNNKTHSERHSNIDMSPGHYKMYLIQGGHWFLIVDLRYGAVTSINLTDDNTDFGKSTLIERQVNGTIPVLCAIDMETIDESAYFNMAFSLTGTDAHGGQISEIRVWRVDYPQGTSSSVPELTASAIRAFSHHEDATFPMALSLLEDRVAFSCLNLRGGEEFKSTFVVNWIEQGNTFSTSDSPPAQRPSSWKIYEKKNLGERRTRPDGHDLFLLPKGNLLSRTSNMFYLYGPEFCGEQSPEEDVTLPNQTFLTRDSECDLDAAEMDDVDANMESWCYSTPDGSTSIFLTHKKNTGSIDEYHVLKINNGSLKLGDRFRFDDCAPGDISHIHPVVLQDEEHGVVGDDPPTIKFSSITPPSYVIHKIPATVVNTPWKNVIAGGKVSVDNLSSRAVISTNRDLLAVNFSIASSSDSEDTHLE